MRPRSGTFNQNIVNVMRPRKNSSPPGISNDIKSKRTKISQDSTPLPSYTSSDVIIDVLKYINRNEIEKCQLLSYNFDSIITSSSILPVYQLQEIIMDNHRGWTAEVPVKTNILKKLTSLNSSLVRLNLNDENVQASLGNCYVKRMKISIRNDGENVLKKLVNIVKHSGKPILAQLCEMVFVMGEYKWLHQIPMIFKDLISTEKFNLVFYTSPPLQYIAKNPSCVELDNPKIEINIETANCYGVNWKKSKSSLYQLIAGEGLETILNRGTIELGHINGSEEDFLASVIKILRNSTKLQYLFKRINFAIQARNRDDTIYHNIFIREGYVPYKSLQGRYQDKQRDDGWIIEVDFNHEYLMEFVILKPGEAREGF
uniref:F-box domain-containing protein n=1 Tax=Acrobeloides nanus TaxID=290746 RepID=A0A914DW54_9BILA